jgi:hypothetical protein
MGAPSDPLSITLEPAMILVPRPTTAFAALAVWPVLLAMPLAAEDVAAPQPAPAAATQTQEKPDEKVSVSTPEIELTPEEKTEKDSRKACKADICSAFRGGRPRGDISCNVVKSWREQLVQARRQDEGLLALWAAAARRSSRSSGPN